MTDREYLIDQVLQERAHQELHNGEGDDLINSPADFITYISYYSTRWLPGSYKPYDVATLVNFRQSMIETAALALAGAELAGKVINGDISRSDLLDG